MAMEDNGDIKIRAAAIARDITVAFASGPQSTSWSNGAKGFADGLALVYETLHAAALKSLGKQ